MMETKEDQLEVLLSNLGMHSFFPKKLFKKDVIKISKDEPDKGLWSLAKHILFLSLNVSSQDTSTTSDDSDSCDEDVLGDVEDTYLSQLMVLFMCSNDFLRKYFVEKLQLNQKAVPFILPVTNELMLWPLRITRAWNQSNEVNEECLPGTVMPVCSALQIGDSSKSSSSKILNMAFTTNQGVYQGFSESNEEVCIGLVEVGWYLPTGKTSDAWHTAIMAANLHGNASSSFSQVKLLLHISDYACILVDDLEADISTISTLLFERKESLIFLHRCYSENDKKAFHDWLKTHNFGECINIPFKSFETAVKKIKIKINKLLPTLHLLSLEDRVSTAAEHSFLVDESNHHCCKGKEMAESIINTINLKPKEDLRKNILPLQEVWKEWSSYNKEQFRLKKLPTTMTSEMYLSQLEYKKECLIESMLEMQSSQEFLRFLTCLKQSESTIQWFLEWFQIMLDQISREAISDIQGRYLKVSIEDPRSERLKLLDDELYQSSFGLEHFFREMAVMWNVCYPRKEKRHLVEWFPVVVADIILQGRPLEVIDADACHVSFKWITTVLNHVKNKINDVDLSVVSILGVQSSGKSTFFNTIFGINLAVGSGRCTKGAFLQLVEVEEDLKASIGCGYVAVIDTEGLKSAELSNFDHERDNELATLTVGISDLSVINLSTENCEAMKDVLQIVCYAFLRMTAVHKQPKCMMVHQNVSDPSSKKKNIQGKVKFLKTLDEMTKLAAGMERANEKYSTFSDVIAYNPETMSVYVPGLWYGTPPMASISGDYALAAQQTKLHMLKEMSCTWHTNLQNFGKRLEDVATAVMRENFIFSFQNTLTAKIHQLLRAFYVQKKWQMKNHVLEWLMIVQRNLKDAKEDEIGNQKGILQEGSSLLEEEVKKLQDEVEAYYEEHKEFSSELKNSRIMIESDLEECKKSLFRDIEMFTDQFVKKEKALKTIHAMTKEKETMIKQRLQQLQCKYSKSEPKLSQDNTAVLKEEFENLWLCVLDGIKYQNKFQNINIKLVMEQCLREYIKEHEKHLGEVSISSSSGDGLVSAEDIVFLEIDCNGEYTVAQKCMEKTIFESKQQISKLTSVPALFTEKLCMDIMRFVDGNIQQNEPSQGFRFTQHYRVKLLKLLCCFSIDKLENMHSKYLRQEDPVQRVNLLKERYYCLLMSGTELENHVKVFCDELAYGIVSSLKPLLPVYISKHIQSSCEILQSNSAIELHMLLDLEKKNSFDDYIEYIRSFKDYTVSWIRQQVIAFMNEHTEGVKRVVYIISTLAANVIDLLCKIIENAANDSGGIYHLFLQHLQERITENKAQVDFDEHSIQRMQLLGVNDTNKFLKCLTMNGKERLQSSLQQKSEAVSIEEELTHMYPSLEEQLFSLMMCEDGAQCPFCGVACGRHGPHNEHAAQMHRPQGLRNYTYGRTELLVHEICTTLVAHDGHFSNKDSNDLQVKNKNYKEVYPDWDIKPSKDIHSSKFWKRFMVRFNKELSDFYKCRPADIPNIWKTYDWEAVKEQLEDIYETEIADFVEEAEEATEDLT